MDKIRPFLNGYGRIIEYGSTNADKNKKSFNPSEASNYIISLSEGSFKKGEFNGFARKLDNQGECRVGFWILDHSNKGDGCSFTRPYGKYCHYYKDGSYKLQEGMYMGNELIECYLLKAQKIDSYMTNYTEQEIKRIIKGAWNSTSK